MNKKIFIYAFFSLLIIASAAIAFNHSQAQTTAGQNALISAADLSISGFTNVQTVPAANGRYAGAYYFSVDEKAAGANSEGPNLVMVSDEQVDYVRTALSFAYSAADKAFTIAGGIGAEGTLPDGRTVIYFDKGKSYLVIIAPNQSFTERLALLLASKISAD